MKRLLLVLAGLVSVVGLASLVATLWSRPFTTILPLFDSTFAVLFSVAAICAFLLAGGDWLERKLLRAPFKAAWKRHVGGNAKKRRVQIDALFEAVEQGQRAPGSVLGDVLHSAESGAEREWPWEAKLQRRWLLDASIGLRNGLMARLLAPERARMLSDASAALAEAFEDYLYYQVVPLAALHKVPVAEKQPVLMADVLTLLTGALVLADASQSRTGVARSTRAWHAPTMPDARRFGASHALGPRRLDDGADPCAWGQSLGRQDKSRAGDFDGRVVDLHGVALVQDERAEGIDFLLLTGENCYAATEVKVDDLHDRRCKGLTAANALTDTPSWSLSAESASARRDEPAKRRSCLLTSFASLTLCYEVDGKFRQSVVLTRRSQGTRNDAGVLSIFGGGVVNLSVGGWRGDEDTEGYVDTAKAARRELREEVGLELSAEQLVPTSVYLLNERGAGPESGQLVATAAFAVTCAMTFSELVILRAQSSTGAGRYESTGLLEVPLPSGDDYDGTPDDRKRSAANEFVNKVCELGNDLDQRAVMALLHAACAAYSSEIAIAAFVSAPSKPWLEAPESHDCTASRPYACLAAPLSALVDEVTWDRLTATATLFGLPAPL